MDKGKRAGGVLHVQGYGKVETCVCKGMGDVEGMKGLLIYKGRNTMVSMVGVREIC